MPHGRSSPGSAAARRTLRRIGSTISEPAIQELPLARRWPVEELVVPARRPKSRGRSKSNVGSCWW